MKKKILIGFSAFLILIIGLLFYMRSSTKKHSPASSASFEYNGFRAEINYCRPYKKGRMIFGEEQAGALQPYGKYWRIGANEATTFIINKPAIVQDKELPAGKYSMYAFPGKDTWTIVFNSDYDRWGYSQPDTKNDIARVEVPADNNAPPEEQFNISFDAPDQTGQTYVELHWDQTLVKIPVRAKN